MPTMVCYLLWVCIHVWSSTSFEEGVFCSVKRMESIVSLQSVVGVSGGSLVKYTPIITGL